MLPVLPVDRIRAADAHTILHEPISSIDLMERAAGRFTDRLIHLHRAGRFGDPERIRYLVVAGMGNNGGDGLVAARLLHAVGIAVRVVRLAHRSDATPDNASNYTRALDAGVRCVDMIDGEKGFQIGEDEVVIDAIVGVGLNAPVTGMIADAVHLINSSGRPVVAVDVPSGLFAEGGLATDPKHVVHATCTITFEVPKLGFFFAENAPYVGDWEIAPIGLHPKFVQEQPVLHRLVERGDVVGLLRPRHRFAHKGTFGHALLVAGGVGHAGAAVLAARSALRSGAGLVTAHVPGGCAPIVQISAPEAMCSADPFESAVTTLPKLDGFSSVGIGPGLGTSEESAVVVKRIVQDASVPLVIDADALNILAQNPTWLAFLPPETILTPHPKEFDRLVDRRVASGFERLELARQLAQKNRCIVVLKGAWTAICDPAGQVFFNPTGNPGMAKGGSGDALTGLLSGLLAQGYAPLRAAVLGVYLHGLAGDIAARDIGMDAMTAGDLIGALPKAWQELRGASEQAVQ